MEFGGWIRRLTPLLLIALAGLVWFEHYLPGHDALARSLGSTAVLRFVVGVACVLLCIQVLEQRRIEVLFKQVIEQFRRFHQEQGRSPTPDAGTQQDAIRILISALGSDDDEVRRTAQENLTRLTGQDFGGDAAAWAEWARQEFGKK